MEALQQELSDIEMRNKLSEADRFDLAQVKEMTSLTFLDECEVPLFQWRLMNIREDPQPWESQLFPVNGDKNIGRLRLDRSIGCTWNLTMTLDENNNNNEEDGEVSSEMSSYFVVKYNHNFDAKSLDDGAFCKRIIVFGSRKNTASVSWHWYWSYCHSILVEVYQVAAAIPHFFTASNKRSNMIVGKSKMSGRAKDEYYEFRFLENHVRFHFGSADQLLTVRLAIESENKEKLNMGVRAALRIVCNKRTGLVPFALTLTIFNQRDRTKDLVKRIVVRPEEKELEQDMDVAFYEDLDDTTEKDILYYKVVLEPLNAM